MLASYNELGPLTYLVGQVAISAPVIQLSDESFLPSEVERIKRRAIQDVEVFADDCKFYLRDNIKSINHLIISIYEVLFRLPELRYLHGLQRYQYEHCNKLKEVLYDLQRFFVQMLASRSL